MIISSYVTFDQQLYITFRKPPPPPPPLRKNPLPPLFTHSPLKIQKVQVPPFCHHWTFFRPPCRNGGVRTLWIHLLNHFIFFSRQCKNKVMLGHSSFQLYEDKKSKWILYNFKAALDYSSLNSSIIFLYCDTTLVPPPP